MHRWIIALASLLFLSVHPNREVQTYAIFYKGDLVGEMTCTRSDNGRSVSYQTESNISTRILVKVNVESFFAATYQNGHLEQSRVNLEVNNRSQAQSRTVRSGSAYDFYSYGEKENEIHSTIGYSAIKLFFEEPQGVRQAYSEERGTFLGIQPAGNHAYDKIDEKGRASRYYYQNGILSRCTLTSGWATFEMVRQ